MEKIYCFCREMNTDFTVRRKKMKKTYILTVLLLMLTLLLAGCGSTDSGQTSSGSSESSAEVTEMQSSSSEAQLPESMEQTVEVFAPSSMTLAMNDLIEAYKAQSGIGKIVANYSDSSSLSDQIRNNADCDIFICEDPAILDQLAAENFLEPDSRTAFSEREIALIAKEDEADEEVKEEAKAFYDFLLSDEAAEIMSTSYDSEVSAEQTQTAN